MSERPPRTDYFREREMWERRVPSLTDSAATSLSINCSRADSKAVVASSMASSHAVTVDPHTAYILQDGTRDFSAYIDVSEITTPAVPAADHLRLFVEDFHGFSFFSFIDQVGMVRKLVRDAVFVVKASENIAIGDAVYVFAQTGNVPEVKKAKADSLTTMPAIGIAIEAIVLNAFGRVMMVGLLEHFDTSLFAIGAPLYVSATTAGLLTATAPLYPNIRQEIGMCLVSGVGNGAMQVLAKSLFNEGIIDHGGMLGLTDDDHTQYSMYAVVTQGATGNVTAAQLRGQVNKVTGAFTLSLPTAAVNYHASFFASTAAVFSIDVLTATDIIILDGVALAAGHKITSDGTLGAKVFIECTEVGYYRATSILGVWVDGGV